MLLDSSRHHHRPLSNTKRVHSHNSITESLFSRRKTTGLCLRPRSKRVEEWGTGATVRQRKAPKRAAKRPDCGERTPARTEKLPSPGGTAGVPTAVRSGLPTLSREEARERGEPLTFSSSDTRSSKSAILGCSGPARPWREGGWEESRVMESQRGPSEGPARKRRPRERHVSYGRG